MNEVSTIKELLRSGQDGAVAIAAPDRAVLTYRSLREQIDTTVTMLNLLGIERNDRVALVLPNGPDMAAAFVSVASGATTAPLNPAYQRDEFHFYLSDLGAKALLVDKGSTSPALCAASDLGIRVLEISAGENAGSFEILTKEDVKPGSSTPKYAHADDVALVLHTSGTTARPKIVPLSHRNVCASAWNIRQTLALAPEDKCMNIMPLFHIHGLMATILATLSAGASVYCTAGFNALKFFGWLKNSEPS